MRQPSVNPRCLLVALMAAGLAPAVAEEPLWELGAGLGAAYFPDYRGADEGRSYVLPVPYLVYRGERLRVDRRGVRGELLERRNLSLGVSANLGPPAESERNAARAGMPDLDSTVEVGPSLNLRLFENAPRDRVLELRLPLRAVVATDLSRADHVGWVFLPHLAYDMRDFGPGGGWSAGLSLGPIFASNEYHDYYYAVRPEFETAARPAYDARGGYSGLSAGLTVSKRYRSYWVGAFVRYDNLRGAVFDDSPLVRANHAVIAGFAVSRILARSERRVPPVREAP